MAEKGLRVQRPTWDQVPKSGGLWAASLASAGHTCDGVPLAISEPRCMNAKWCHTGCIFGAKNSLITNYVGLYWIDGSIVPTSLVARRADLGLPHRPRHWRAGVPPRHIGKRVVPAHA